MATSEGIPSSIDIEFLELNDNPYGRTSKIKTHFHTLLAHRNYSAVALHP